MEKKTLNDALVRAAQDQEFAVKLVKNPRQFQEEYQLTEAQMENISAAGQAAQNVANTNMQAYFS